MKNRVKMKSVTAADCEWQYFRAGGNGGQAQNKTSSGVRVIHHPSGARGESREKRSQLANRRNAWRRMGSSKEFLAWTKKEAGISLVSEAEIQYAVEKAVHPRNLLVEVWDGKKWVEIPKT